MILICGIPNSGKTTYSRRFGKVVHFDAQRGPTESMFDSVLEAVAMNPGVCVEGVYGNVEERKRLVKAAGGSRNTCIWLDVPLETCVEREKAYRNRPEMTVRLAHERFAPPTFGEGWDEIVVLGRDGDGSLWPATNT